MHVPAQTATASLYPLIELRTDATSQLVQSRIHVYVDIPAPPRLAQLNVLLDAFC